MHSFNCEFAFAIQAINNSTHLVEDRFRSVLVHYLTHTELHPQWSDIIRALLAPAVDCPHLICGVAELAESEIRVAEKGAGAVCCYIQVAVYKIRKHFQSVFLVGIASKIKCVDHSRHNRIKGAKAKCAHISNFSL